MSLADKRALRRGDAATLVPPRDVHNHGRVIGTCPSPYSLILLGDDMLVFEREEYDPEPGDLAKVRARRPGPVEPLTFELTRRGPRSGRTGQVLRRHPVPRRT